MKRSDILFAGLAAILLSINAWGAFTGFPVMDDGELLTTAREAGLAAVVPANRDRPINGWLIEESVRVLGERPALWAALAGAMWALLAWQTARMVRRLFPGHAELAGVSALLVIAPLVVEMQYTTQTFVFAASLPVSLTMEAILQSLSPNAQKKPGLPRMALVAGLAAAGALISEYGIATAVAGIALLLTLRRTRAAALLLLGCALGHLGFRSISDLTARPDTMASVQIARSLDRLLQLPVRWISGVWYSLVGAYGTAAGSVRLDLSSGSSIVAVGVGGACAVAVALAYRDGAREGQPGRRRELVGLLLAVGAGLLPSVAVSRTPDSGWFLSRFRLPILPFAIAATLYLLERLMAPRRRFVSGALLAFLAGHAVVAGAFKVQRHQRLYDEIAQLVLPLARESKGLTVAVLSDPPYSVAWAKLMYHWSVDDELRVWALKDGIAERAFGTRGACQATDHLHVPPTLRTTGREGPISRLLWVRRGEKGEITLEPYCATSPR